MAAGLPGECQHTFYVFLIHLFLRIFSGRGIQNGIPSSIFFTVSYGLPVGSPREHLYDSVYPQPFVSIFIENIVVRLNVNGICHCIEKTDHRFFVKVCYQGLHRALGTPCSV